MTALFEQSMTPVELLEQSLNAKPLAEVREQCMKSPTRRLYYEEMANHTMFLYLPSAVLFKLACSINNCFTFDLRRMQVLLKKNIEAAQYCNFIAANFSFHLQLTLDRNCIWLPEQSTIDFMDPLDPRCHLDRFIVGRIVEHRINYTKNTESVAGYYQDIKSLHTDFKQMKYVVLLPREMPSDCTDGICNGIRNPNMKVRSCPALGFHIFCEDKIPPSILNYRDICDPAAVHHQCNAIASDWTLIRKHMEKALKFIKEFYLDIPTILLPKILMYFSSFFIPDIDFSSVWYRTSGMRQAEVSYIKWITELKIESFAASEFRIYLPPVTFSADTMEEFSLIGDTLFIRKLRVMRQILSLLIQFRDRPFEEVWALLCFVPIPFLPITQKRIE